MATLRTSEVTHKNLKSLANMTGLSIQSVLDQAVETYRRTIFLEKLNADFAALRSNSQEWQEEQEERELWANTLSDGLSNQGE